MRAVGVLLAIALLTVTVVVSVLADIRPCGEFQILCDCQLICQHGTAFGSDCESEYFKAEVCARGSVVLDPWFVNAVQTQLDLVDDVPLNYGQLPSTHNSCITKAEGYGVGEDQLTELIHFLDKHTYVRIANQQVTITDQLRLGVRMIELDTHYFDGDIRIGHCGGVDIKALNGLVALLGKLINRTIDWDTETLGCFSPRSHRLADVFGEIAAFLAAPGNERVVLVLMYDDQEDLDTWGKVPELLALMRQYFNDTIFTAEDKARLFPNRWPSPAEMRALGRRVVFANGQDYGADMYPLIFYKYGPAFANWTEFDPDDLRPYPACTLQGVPTATGRIIRVVSDSLVYGPFWNGTAHGELDAQSLPLHVGCGVNWPSLDQCRPEVMRAGLWTWAQGEPRPDGCAALDAASGRWVTAPCASSLPYACRGGDGSWTVAGAGAWQPAGSEAVCGAAGTYDVPRNGLDGMRLHAALLQAGAAAVWLPYP